MRLPPQKKQLSATFEQMQETFAAHGHGSDLYACTDPFCMEAKMAIIEALQQIMNPQQPQQGGM